MSSERNNSILCTARFAWYTLDRVTLAQYSKLRSLRESLVARAERLVLSDQRGRRTAGPLLVATDSRLVRSVSNRIAKIAVCAFAFARRFGVLAV